ncbi:hypothetical protein ACFLSJ_01015 [Verrucomicrobiota bacterium]
MITERDIRFLSRARSKTTIRFANGALAFALLTCIVVGILNLNLAAKYARVEGMSFGELVNAWTDGWDSQKHYSGVYCRANERLCTGLMQMVLALCFVLPVWIGANVRWARHRRILAFIEEARSEQPSP